MKEITIAELGENMVMAISKEWMLVTAGTAESWNTMTASWGGIGYLWGRPVVFVFVRPERYTHEFIERSERFTLSFLGKDHRDILSFCGSHSGRDCDKAAATGLHPAITADGCVMFEQARLTLQCRKLYCSEMQADKFIESQCIERWYGTGEGMSFHTVYVAEIEHIYTR